MLFYDGDFPFCKYRISSVPPHSGFPHVHKDAGEARRPPRALCNPATDQQPGRSRSVNQTLYNLVSPSVNGWQQRVCVEAGMNWRDVTALSCRLYAFGGHADLLAISSAACTGIACGLQDFLHWRTTRAVQYGGQCISSSLGVCSRLRCCSQRHDHAGGLSSAVHWQHAPGRCCSRQRGHRRNAPWLS